MVCAQGGGSSPGIWHLQGLQAQGRSRGGGLRLGRTKDSGRTQGPMGGSGSQTQGGLMLFLASQQDEGLKSDITYLKK